jgi:hypothetical protein
MKKPGRPSQSKERVHFMIDRALMRRMRRKAKEDNRPISNQAEVLIERGLSQETEPV